jgi:O-antigen/teichoic acid export membrane protein
MKVPLPRTNNNLKYQKIYNWGKLITITGGAQVIVQGTGLVCGIIVIRLLSTQEYAWYTLANTMLGTMTMLADGGISIGVMAEGAKVWQNKEHLGSVLATGMSLKKRFALTTILVAAPLLIYMLLSHGANWITTILICASLVPAFFAALSDSLLEVIPKLHQSIHSLQKNQIVVSITRLLLSSLILFVFPFTFLAILANGIPRAYGNIRLRKISNSFINPSPKVDAEIRKNILKIVKRIMPEAIYFSMSGNITIWLIAWMGNTTSIAEMGALGRLAMFLNVFTVIFSTVIIPRFARLGKNKNILLKRFFQTIAIVVIICIFIIAITKIFPTQILWILGKNYEGLQPSLLLLSIYAACLNLLIGIIFNLYSSRGWIINPIISIAVSISSILAGILLFNISTLYGVLLMNVFIAIVQLILHTTYCTKKILSITTEKAD